MKKVARREAAVAALVFAEAWGTRSLHGLTTGIGAEGTGDGGAGDIDGGAGDDWACQPTLRPVTAEGPFASPPPPPPTPTTLPPEPAPPACPPPEGSRRPRPPPPRSDARSEGAPLPRPLRALMPCVLLASNAAPAPAADLADLVVCGRALGAKAEAKSKPEPELKDARGKENARDAREDGKEGEKRPRWA